MHKEVFTLGFQFSRSVVSSSLQPCGQHARLPCPSPTPGACSNSCPSSWWCHPVILSSVIPFSSCLQSFPASGSFPVSQFFVSGGQSIEASASASVLPVNIQGWFPLGLIGLISLLSKGISKFSPTPQFESIDSLVLSLLLLSNCHNCMWLLEKPTGYYELCIPLPSSSNIGTFGVLEISFSLPYWFLTFEGQVI